jgi:sensor histidine kinase YesM
MDNTNTFKQKITRVFNDNYGWILLITGIIALVLLTQLDDFVITLIKIFIIEKNQNTSNFYGLELYVETILSISLVLILTIAILIGLGNFFYHLFFKYILKKTNAVYVIAFVIWILVFFSLFWEGLQWILVKNNMLEVKYFYDGKESLALYKQNVIKEYRDNYVTVISALVFLFIIAFGLIKNYIQNTKTQAKLIAQKSQAELMALKAQINPHFLFNVLNNLYGSAIVEDSPKTSEGILQLSSIMRHVVEGTKNERIEVEKEIRFLNDYIELNKMRIPNRPNIRIVTEIFWDENPTMIAPLLVIPYLENAFKYGISTTEECFIEMSFRIENQKLSFVCKNSIIKTDDKLEVGTGTGLDNTKRRLDLYYPTAYQLSTSSSDNIFVVNLEVNL